MSEIDEFQEFHPRAVKLMRKRKDFIVVACDEPYYMQAYSLIRQNEIAKGTWSAVDESCFIRAAQQRNEAAKAGRQLKSGSAICPRCGNVLLVLGKIKEPCFKCRQEGYGVKKAW